MKTMMLIDKDLANAILNHVAKSPYNEVYQLCDALRNLKESPIQYPVTDETPEAKK